MNFQLSINLHITHWYDEVWGSQLFPSRCVQGIMNWGERLGHSMPCLQSNLSRSAEASIPRRVLRRRLSVLRFLSKLGRLLLIRSALYENRWKTASVDIESRRFAPGRSSSAAMQLWRAFSFRRRASLSFVQCSYSPDTQGLDPLRWDWKKVRSVQGRSLDWRLVTDKSPLHSSRPAVATLRFLNRTHVWIGKPETRVRQIMGDPILLTDRLGYVVAARKPIRSSERFKNSAIFGTRQMRMRPISQLLKKAPGWAKRLTEIFRSADLHWALASRFDSILRLAGLARTRPTSGFRNPSFRIQQVRNQQPQTR